MPRKKDTYETKVMKAQAKRLALLAEATRQRPMHIARTMQVADELVNRQLTKQLNGLSDTMRIKAEAKAKAEALVREYETFQAAEKARLIASVNAPAVGSNGPEAGPSSDRTEPLDLSQERIVGLDDLL